MSVRVGDQAGRTDLNRDGTPDSADLTILPSSWGPPVSDASIPKVRATVAAAPPLRGAAVVVRWRNVNRWSAPPRRPR